MHNGIFQDIVIFVDNIFDSEIIFQIDYERQGTKLTSNLRSIVHRKIDTNELVRLLCTNIVRIFIKYLYDFNSILL